MAGKVISQIPGFEFGNDKKIDNMVKKLSDLLENSDNTGSYVEELKNNKKKIIEDQKDFIEQLKTLSGDEAKLKREQIKENKNILNSLSDHINDEIAKNIKLESQIKSLSADLEKTGKITKDQIQFITDNVKDATFNFQNSSQVFSSSLSSLHSHAISGFSNILTSTKSFFQEFGVIGELMNQAFHQIQELNKDLVAFNRNMGMGNLSNKTFGMDLYGNAMGGSSSLTSLVMQNAINEKEFLSTFYSFNKGKTMGTTETSFSNQQDNMEKFGISAAQLGKFYGVEMGTINNITSNLVYSFGTKIQDLNKILDDGKTIAAASGLSVKEYFNNLKEASDQVGKYYIAGGIKGLQDLALYATKTNQTVNQVLSSTDRFKNFVSQFELQNNAAALGFAATSENMTKSWAYAAKGDQVTANKIFLSNIAKDLINNGGAIDGKISDVGMMNMKSMGMTEEEIKSTQKLLNMQKELGMSIEQLTNQNELDYKQKAKISQFEEKNLTIGERFSELWGKLRAVFVDPLAAVITPIVNGLISFGNIVADVVGSLGVIFITGPMSMLGKALGKISELFEIWAAFFAPAINKANEFVNSLEKMGWLSKIIGAVIGGFEVLLLGRWLAPGIIKVFGAITSSVGTLKGAGSQLIIAAQRLMGVGATSNVIPGIPGRAPGITSKGFWKLPAAGSLGANLSKGLGMGGGIAIGGNLLGMGASALGHEEAGQYLSTAGNYAGMGTALGSFAGPMGMLAGGIIGAVAGLGKTAWDIYYKEKDDKDQSQNKDKFDGAYTSNFVNTKDIAAMLARRQEYAKHIGDENKKVPSLKGTSSGVIHLTVNNKFGSSFTTTVYE